MDPSFWAGLFQAAPDILAIEFGFIQDLFGIKSKEQKMQENVLETQKQMLQMQIDGQLALDQNKTARQKQMFDFWTENMTYCVLGLTVVVGGAVAISAED